MEKGVSKLTETELGWLAGLLEGEGYFGLRSDTKTPQLKLEMTDEDIVLRALVLIQRITGKQHTITAVTRPNKNIAMTFVIALYSIDAIKVMKVIVKLMGMRRRQKIWQTLNGYGEKKQKLPTSLIESLKPKPKLAEVVVPLQRRSL